jgi:hypothetical protein
MNRLTRIGVAAAVVFAASASHAVRALDAPPTRAPVLKKESKADAAAQADDSAGLRQGVVADISAKRDWVQVNGTWLAIVEGRTTLIQRGRPANAAVLGKGQLLKFTLAPGAANRTTLGVVYVP